MSTTETVPVKAKKQDNVSREEFSKVTGILEIIIGRLDAMAVKTATPAEAKEASEISKAKPDNAPIPESWEETAREIVGEALDHCELFQPRGGGTLFTIVIKPEFSNAPKDYLERMKFDRRTKELGSEGIAGVELFSKLVRAHLKRSAAK